MTGSAAVQAVLAQLYVISQLSMWPVFVSRHMMSLTPLWSESPIPTGTAPAGCAPTPTLPAHWPSAIFHRSMSHVVELNRSTSLVPLWLKSAKPNRLISGRVGPGVGTAGRGIFRDCRGALPFGEAWAELTRVGLVAELTNWHDLTRGSGASGVMN